MAYITFDQSTRPMVYAVVAPIEPTQEQWAAFMRDFAELLSGDAPFAILFDLTHAKLVSMSMIQEFASFMKTHDESLKKKIIASAVVSASVLVRSLLDIIFTFRKPAKPNIVTKHVDKATTFLVNACQEAGAL